MEHIPRTIRAGTTLKLSFNLPAYPAPGWAASLILRGPGQIDLESEADGTLHKFNVPADETGEWSAGKYWYALRVEKDGEIIQVSDGMIHIVADLAGVSDEFDGRDHVQKVIDAIEAVIEGRASIDQESYAINNRQLKRTPIADLIKLRDRYKEELRRQEASKKSGGSLLGRPVYVRFS